MNEPLLSEHFCGRRPSSIRLAQMEFAQRTDDTQAINVAIGNVSLPMHPALQKRMANLGSPTSPFATGVVRYSATVGMAETQTAFLNIIASSGGLIDGLSCQITEGGSQAMELAIVGCCGPAGSDSGPLMLIDAAYTNYTAFAARLGRRTVSITRHLDKNGQFSLPNADEIRAQISATQPAAMVIIPYDNPTGQLYSRESLIGLARICVANNMWIISDEAYRELYYTTDSPISIWSLTEQEVPGIRGRRLSIETASKVWNACGLRIGALVTDSPEFHRGAVAENTANLCSNVIGQYIFGALAGESHADLQLWYERQRNYYSGMMQEFSRGLQRLLPEAIVSRPDASIYSVVDLREMVPDGFEALDFVLFCARHGRCQIDSQVEGQVDGQAWTLLMAPMSGFYTVSAGAANPGRTQLRVAYVATPERMRYVPGLLADLLGQYLES